MRGFQENLLEKSIKESHKDNSIILIVIKELQRDVEDYIDDLRKSNDIFRESQDKLADMILDRIQKFKLKYLEAQNGKEIK